MQSLTKYDTASRVEETALKKSGRQFIYPPGEKIKSIVVENLPMLGKLTQPWGSNLPSHRQNP